MKQKVHVVGVGAYTSLGSSLLTTWEGLVEGRSGVRGIRRFDAEGLPARIAATVDDDGATSCAQRAIVMGRSAIEEAVRASRAPAEALRDAGFFLAVATSEADWPAMLRTRTTPPNAPTDVFFADEFASAFGEALASPYEARTPPFLVNTACASGATALEMALEELEAGALDLAVVAGSDSSVYEESIAKFCLLSALSTSNDAPAAACRPFSADRDGFVMGEGAGALILASDAGVARHGLTPLATLRGAGNATDGFHRTRSSPDGSTIIASMARALEKAGLAPDQIDHVNAHGTGTPENDKMESLGLRAVFGDQVARIPVTANKSMIGHTLTAAGAIEAVVSVMTLATGIIPPTLNYERPDGDLGVKVAGNRALRAPVRHVLSNSFGFGGQNVSLVFSHPSEA